jgi:hypothetical protein
MSSAKSESELVTARQHSVNDFSSQATFVKLRTNNETTAYKHVGSPIARKLKALDPERRRSFIAVVERLQDCRTKFESLRKSSDEAIKQNK